MNLKNRLNNAENKKDALQKDLLDVQKELSGINRGSFGITGFVV